MFTVLKILVDSLMPIRLHWIGAAIAGGAALLGGALNRRGSKKATNEMNKYNSPAKQMQRLKDAGLNPNLMYGTGTVGNQPAPRNIQYDLGNAASEGLNQYQSMRLNKAQSELYEAKVQYQFIDNYIRETDAIDAGMKRVWLKHGKENLSPSTKYGGSVNPQVFKKHVDNWTSQLSQAQLQVVYQDLKNRYQKVATQIVEEDGIRLEDAPKVKAILKVVNMVGEKLGFDPINLK